MWPGFSRFAANAGKTAHIRMRPRECGEGTTLPGEAECAVQQASRVIDFSERPQDHRQPAHGNDPVIEDEPGAKMVIPLVVIGREGPFKVRVRADVRLGTNKSRQGHAAPAAGNPGESRTSRRKAI